MPIAASVPRGSEMTVCVIVGVWVGVGVAKTSAVWSHTARSSGRASGTCLISFDLICSFIYIGK